MTPSVVVWLLLTRQDGRRVMPEDLGPRHRPRRKGSLSNNLRRLFGNKAIAKLDGEETKVATAECVVHGQCHAARFCAPHTACADL